MNEFKVGLMALASMIAVVVMSLVVTSNQSGFGEYVPYKTIIKNASGIFPKTPIKVAGINAGRIKSIELQGNQALISFEVLERVKITENSVLKIKSVGFLGDKYLEIFVGTSENRLSSGATIRSEEGGGMEALVKDASDVMKDVKDIVSSLKGSLAPEGQKAPITVILDDVKDLVKNTKEMTSSLKRIINGNEQKLNDMIANLETFSEDLAFHMNQDEPESVVADVQQILSKTDNMMKDLSAIVSNMRDGKGTVGKLLVEEEIADDVRQTLAGVKRIFNRVDNIRTELTFFTGANTTSGNSVTDFALRIIPAPERFYHLGIRTTEFGPISEEIRTVSINGGADTVTNEKIRQKDDIVVNLQLGRNIQDWTFRGGLIESTGGFGVDYFMREIGTKFSIEGFDYRDDLGVNWRFTTDVRIWSAVYGQVQIEDFMNTPNYIFNAGLRFNDEDLQALIAFFLR